MVAKINEGDFRGACAALLTSKIVNGKRVYTGWYIRAQGRVVQGLINRRRDDQKMCLSGLDKKAAATPPAAPFILKPLTKAEFAIDPYSCFGAGRYEAMSEGKKCPIKKWWQR
jgi:hypothetical protein